HTQGVCGYPPLDEHLEKCMTPLRQVFREPFLLEVEATEYGVLQVVPAGKRTTPCTLRRVGEALAADGFRLPTSDEWEHACAAGSRTFWRWGDHPPLVGEARRLPA